MSHSADKPTTDTDEHRWQAVRDRQCDVRPAFFYAVRSTGIYCRPGCASRLPRRENVSFFETCEQAERDGYRPCRRCRPSQTESANGMEEQVIAACRRLEQQPVPTLQELAGQAGCSPFQFQRLFKTVTGLTPQAYARGHRARLLQEQLRPDQTGTQTVTTAMLESGFQSNGTFYRETRQRLGLTPSRLKQGAPGERLCFAIGPCSLGHVLVASSDRGVVCLLLGDDPQSVLSEFQERFPKAELVGGQSDYEQVVAAAIRIVDQPQAGWDLPLDIRGTVFQQQVWTALQGIPAGQTITYLELARRIGRPGSVRAAASACAANPVAVVVPCHRVVRTGGELAGYRWGLQRKQALLKAEQEFAGNDLEDAGD